MLRLARYIKPYLWLVLVAIALLFVQANADLALPDYLSKIVNVGIQQGGVESAVPQAIRQSEMNRLGLFLSAADKAQVLGDYTLVDKSSPDYDAWLKQYPALAQAPIYVLKNVDPAETASLAPKIAKAFLAVNGIEQVMADPSKAAALGMSGQGGFDLSKLPAGTDLFALIAKLPAAQLAQITDAVNQRFATLGDSMLAQAGVAPVKAEYAALGRDTGQVQNAYILRTGGIMLLLSLLSVVCTFVVGFLSARTAAGLARDLRRLVFQKVIGFSNSEFDKFSTASLITRSTNDITQVQMFVIMMVRMVFYAPIIGVGGVIRAIGKDSSMWWLIALAVGVLLLLVLVVFQVSVPKFKVIQNLIDRLNLVMRENLAGMMVIRAFDMQAAEEKRFEKANSDLTGVNLFVSRVMVVMMPLMMFIMNGLSLLIIWIGAQQVAESRMQVGDMMAFMQYAMQIVFSFLMLTFMFIILPRAQVSAGRIADVIETGVSIRDPEQPRRFAEPFAGTVEFRDVSFRYPHAEEDVLCGVSFTARPGETTALIGATGSGKSTVVNLIPRFYDVSGGSILVDGTDIRQVTQHDLRDKIGYVPQKSTLFSGTIESNLRYADEGASDELVRDSAEIAQANEFIEAKPEKMAAEISQSGSNVSGGQKQRLSIARALVKQAPIYIFDDSFSALDFKTDAALRRAMKERTGDSTLLIVTQRVSTIKNADQIVVMDEGRVVGKGTHRELMDTCPTYQEIALSQLSLEELS